MPRLKRTRRDLFKQPRASEIRRRFELHSGCEKRKNLCFVSLSAARFARAKTVCVSLAAKKGVYNLISMARVSVRATSYKKLTSFQVKTLLRWRKKTWRDSKGKAQKWSAAKIATHFGYCRTTVQSIIAIHEAGGPAQQTLDQKIRRAVSAVMREALVLKRCKWAPRKRICFGEVDATLRAKLKRFHLKASEIPKRTKLSAMIRNVSAECRKRGRRGEPKIKNKEITDDGFRSLRASCGGW